MRILLPALLLASGLAAAPAAADDGTIGLKPEQIGQIFCLSRLGGDEGPIRGIQTPVLAAAIDDAWARNDEWLAANPPGEKPPLGDGIPWQSWPDYAPQCSVGEASYEMDEAGVAIEYAFPAEPDANFTDTLRLKLIEGQYGWRVWRLDNVAYEVGGDLRTALVSAFIEN